MSFINRHATEPFFLYLAYNAVHTPFDTPPQNYMDRVANITNPNRRTYAAMATALDDGVGQVLQALQGQNLLSNTLVFFLSDNGGENNPNRARNYPLRGYKHDVLEGGIHVPFAVQWTGRLPGNNVYDEPVSSLDIVATAAAAAGVQLPTDRVYDGFNLIPFLAREQVAPPRTLFWRWFGLGASGPPCGPDRSARYFGRIPRHHMGGPQWCAKTRGGKRHDQSARLAVQFADRYWRNPKFSSGATWRRQHPDKPIQSME